MVVNETLNTAALDVPATTLRLGGVICGAHLADPVGARWSIASFELDRLTAWTSPTGFSRTIELTPSATHDRLPIDTTFQRMLSSTCREERYGSDRPSKRPATFSTTRTFGSPSRRT
jgi:hypothetical protein